jgi:cytochrome c553
VKRLLLLCSVLALVACTKDVDAGVVSKGDDASKAQVASEAQVAATPVEPSDDSDCNLQTVLDPNKPGSPGHLIKSTRNPNGDSELAVLMRRFVSTLQDARLVVQAGQKAEPLFPIHRTMRCAWPTKPSDRDEGFDARAQAYLAAVRGFDAVPGKDSYNAVVSSCVSCHQVSCGGVIDFIETLRWQ